MRTVLNSLITLVWGLWFGGVITLFLAVSMIFGVFTNDHATAGNVARHVFRAFNMYQLALAGIALVATFLWCLLGQGKLKLGLFLLFGLATFAACVTTMYVAPKIEHLQQQGLVSTPQFARMHGISMLLYVAEAVLLLIAGLFLPWMRTGGTR